MYSTLVKLGSDLQDWKRQRKVSPRGRFWGICLHASYPIVDWSMMRDFFPDPMAEFHGAENKTRGSTVCCLEPSSSLPGGTTHYPHAGQ